MESLSCVGTTGLQSAQLNQTCWSTWSSSKANRKVQTLSEVASHLKNMFKDPIFGSFPTQPPYDQIILYSPNVCVCVCVREREREKQLRKRKPVSQLSNLKISNFFHSIPKENHIVDRDYPCPWKRNPRKSWHPSFPNAEGLRKAETGSKTLRISLIASSLLQDRHALLNSSSP